MDTKKQTSSKNSYVIAYGVLGVILLAVIGALIVISTNTNQNPEIKLNSPDINSGIVENTETDALSEGEGEIVEETEIESPDDIYTNIDVFDVRDKLDVGDYDYVIDLFEGLDEMNDAERSLYLSALLNKGNYYYQNEDMATKVQEYLEGIENKTWNDYYYLGYSKEVIKDYTGAIETYEIALEMIQADSDKSIVTNQIGHVHDLDGDMEEAFNFYTQAYELDSENTSAIENLGRYYLRKGDIEKAKEYFYSLVESANVDETNKAEIYYTLAEMELELNGYNPDIEEIIELANKGIESFADYPMNYIVLAKANLLKDSIEYYSEVEKNLDKAIELNPDSFHAYRLYGWYYFERAESENDIINSIESLEIAKENLLRDMILMDDERENYYYGIMDDVAIITLITQTWGDVDKQIELLEGNLEVHHPYIEFQLKREKNGVFEYLEDETRFQEIILQLN